MAATLVLGGAAHAAKPRVLYTFNGGGDGGYPSGNLVMDAAGNLYGTTQFGGVGHPPQCSTTGCGTVFKLAPGGTETVLHAFTGGATDGRFPYMSNLVMDSAGNIYGTTEFGGLGGQSDCQGTGCGTVFKITPDGTESILHFFTYGSDGVEPASGLIIDKHGNLYGTALGGPAGQTAGGVVFKITPEGTETLLHTFVEGDESIFPIGQLVLDKAGNIYGTAQQGGNTCGFITCGTVFEIASDGTESTVYAFTGGGTDGANPWGGLIRDAAGNLYGTTRNGGGCTTGGDEGCGVVFKITPEGSESVLHIFQGGAGDGSHPMGTLLLDNAGDLIGLTAQGGAGCSGGCGVIFRITPDGTESVLADLGNKLGSSPLNGLIRDHRGILYGVTSDGKKGAANGTVFRFRP